MTTQACTAVVGGPSQSKTFSKTATDGQWSGNVMVDTLSSQNLGLIMPGATIDNVCVQYNEGSAIWRIIASQSLIIRRWGYASKEANADRSECAITPYSVALDDILEIYPQDLDSTSNQSSVVAWVTTSKGFMDFGGTDIVDGTATEIKSLINSQGIGDVFFGSTLTAITVQAGDGERVANIQIIDSAGGTIFTANGGNRLPTAGGYSTQYNLLIENVAIKIEKGYTLKVTTVTG